MNDDNNIQNTDFEEVTDEQKIIRGKSLYFSTSQVADQLNQPDSKIRYYSNVFQDILKIEISNKQRRYTEQDIEKLKFIIELKDEGMTLKQISEYCKEISFEEGTSITVKESNPLSIQAMAKALMEEQHKQMLEFKEEVINVISKQLEIQAEINKFNNEKLKEDIVEQVVITVDDVIADKLDEQSKEIESKFQHIADENEKQFTDKWEKIEQKLNQSLEDKKKQYEQEQEIKKNKGLWDKISNVFRHDKE